MSEHAQACPHCGAPASKPMQDDVPPTAPVTKSVESLPTVSRRRRRRSAIGIVVLWTVGGLTAWFAVTNIPIGKATLTVKKINTLLGREFHFLWEPAEKKAEH